MDHSWIMVDHDDHHHDHHHHHDHDDDPWMMQMDRPWSEWVRMGRIGIAMARTGRDSSSNILRVMKRHVKTFALRDFHNFSMKDI